MNPADPALRLMDYHSLNTKLAQPGGFHNGRSAGEKDIVNDGPLQGLVADCPAMSFVFVDINIRNTNQSNCVTQVFPTFQVFVFAFMRNSEFLWFFQSILRVCAFLPRILSRKKAGMFVNRCCTLCFAFSLQPDQDYSRIKVKTAPASKHLHLHLETENV